MVPGGCQGNFVLSVALVLKTKQSSGELQTAVSLLCMSAYTHTYSNCMSIYEIHPSNTVFLIGTSSYTFWEEGRAGRWKEGDMFRLYPLKCF